MPSIEKKKKIGLNLLIKKGKKEKGVAATPLGGGWECEPPPEMGPATPAFL
jgi:hypothetical protein